MHRVIVLADEVDKPLGCYLPGTLNPAKVTKALDITKACTRVQASGDRSTVYYGEHLHWPIVGLKLNYAGCGSSHRALYLPWGAGRWMPQGRLIKWGSFADWASDLGIDMGLLAQIIFSHLPEGSL
jgi:hypothetical protein